MIKKHIFLKLHQLQKGISKEVIKKQSLKEKLLQLRK